MNTAHYATKAEQSYYLKCHERRHYKTWPRRYTTPLQKEKENNSFGRNLHNKADMDNNSKSPFRVIHMYPYITFYRLPIILINNLFLYLPKYLIFRCKKMSSLPRATYKTRTVASSNWSQNTWHGPQLSFVQVRIHVMLLTSMDCREVWQCSTCNRVSGYQKFPIIPKHECWFHWLEKFHSSWNHLFAWTIYLSFNFGRHLFSVVTRNIH